MMWVPLDGTHYDVTGAVSTGPVQVKWIEQLTQREMQFNFTLHADGKYKLHHGGFILMPLGTHTLRYPGHQHIGIIFD